MGFVCKVEDVNAVEAWLGSLPGQAYADLRRPLRLVAEPLRHDADVGDLAGAVAQRPPDRRMRQARPSGATSRRCWWPAPPARRRFASTCTRGTSATP